MFLLLRNLHILDTFWGIWLPGLFSVYNLFVMKSFFEGLPKEIEESATIDGAGDPMIQARIVLPLMVRLYQLIQVNSLDSILDNSELKLVQPESIKASAIVISVLPILGPFLQKYFVKGVLLGAVKG